MNDPSYAAFDRDSGVQMMPSRGFSKLREHAIDRIKRAAFARLHRSARGERWLLGLYQAGEEVTELALRDDCREPAPAWLADRLERHLADERHHAAAFRRAIETAGGRAGAPAHPDRLSRRKIARWRRLARRHAPHFAHGLYVPLYATALCGERMAVRILERHCAVIDRQHPWQPLLSRVLDDERHHVQLCIDTLRRLVTPDEAPRLAALLREVRAIEASFGVTGAIVMYAVSVGMSWLPDRPAA